MTVIKGKEIVKHVPCNFPKAHQLMSNNLYFPSDCFKPINPQAPVCGTALKPGAGTEDGNLTSLTAQLILGESLTRDFNS